MKKALLTFIILATVLTGFAQVAVNSDGSSPDNSAMLDVKSDTAGILIPRMTATQRDAITAPAQGLMVFVTTDSTFYFYDNSGWKPVGRGASGWNVNSSNVYVDSTHNVVIGTNSTAGAFEVVTDIASGNYTADQCTDGTASASEYQGSHVPANAFDDDLLSLWRNNGNFNTYLEYDFGNGNQKAITKYRLYWEGADVNLSPWSWYFSGSNDGSHWTILDYQFGQVWTSGEWKENTITNTTQYRYYQFNFIHSYNGGDNYYINEIELKETIFNNHPTLFVANNKVGIGTDSPSATLEINNSLKFTDGNEASGNVLTSDASGNASWTDASTITNTLDAAYDNGGPGTGRSIVADTGAVRIDGTDGFLVTGTYGNGDTVEVSGSGTRMFFNPRKAAFRVGEAYNDTWDNKNIGEYSVAMGVNASASGVVSIAIGEGASSSGDESVSIGTYTNANSMYSTAFGNLSLASAPYSTAMGHGTTASGWYSTAIGSGTTASGYYAFASGQSTTAPSYAETAIGSYNTNYTPVDNINWHPSDRLFVIGNSQGPSTAHNALTIYKNGRMNINDEYFMPQNDGAAGQIMQTDGSGQVSFVDASSLGLDDDDFYKTGTTQPPTSINDSIYTMGNVAIGTNTNNYYPLNVHTSTAYRGINVEVSTSANESFGFYSKLLGNSSREYGIENQISGSSNGTLYGCYNLVDNSGNGHHYGLFNWLNGTGSGTQYGLKNWISNIGNGLQYGILNSLSSNGGSGKHYGLYNNLTGNGTGEQYGVENLITNTGNAVHYGNYSELSGSGSGDHYGSYIKLTGSGSGQQYGYMSFNDNSGNQRHYGLFTHLEGTGTGYHFGVMNELAGTGTGNQFGTLNNMTNSGDGTHFGVKSFMTGTGNGIHYGTWNYINGTGTGNKYGTYDSIVSTAGGTHYGVYSISEGASNYAGYFKGNVHVTERFTAPVSGNDADLKPYIYGSLKNTDGSYFINESTDGFTSTKESTGVYKITFDSYNSDNYYLVIANALRTSGPVILTYQKASGYFRIRAWDINGNLVDTYLNFVVYKK